MKHFYKAGGDWKTEDGFEYTIKAVEWKEEEDYLADGWCASLDDVRSGNTPEPESEPEMDDHERSLRDQIKALGGKAAGRSSVETLEKQLAQMQELQNGNDN